MVRFIPVDNAEMKRPISFEFISLVNYFSSVAVFVFNWECLTE